MRSQAIACFLVAASLVALQPAHAQLQPESATPRSSARERADLLDALMRRLQAAANEAEAESIVRDIRRLWMQFDDPDAEIALEEAVMLLGRGLLRPALDVLDGLLARTPRFAEAWYRRASVHYVLNDPHRARADLDRTIALEPRHFLALMTRGQVFLEQRDWKGALADFRAALRFHPFLKGARQMLPDLQRLAGDRGI